MAYSLLRISTRKIALTNTVSSENKLAVMCTKLLYKSILHRVNLSLQSTFNKRTLFIKHTKLTTDSDKHMHLLSRVYIYFLPSMVLSSLTSCSDNDAFMIADLACTIFDSLETMGI